MTTTTTATFLDPIAEARARWAAYLGDAAPDGEATLDRAEVLEYLANAWPEIPSTTARTLVLAQGAGRVRANDLFGDGDFLDLWAQEGIDRALAAWLRRQRGGDQLALIV